MKFLTAIILLVFAFGDLAYVQAQDRIPREFSDPDQIISFDRRTSFVEAVEILNRFAQDYDNRFIIDRTGYEGEIGVSLPPMHWRDALDYILRVQNFVALESPDVFELVTAEQARQMRTTDSSQPQQAAQAGEDELIIDTNTREVRINATFFEGSRRALREIGVDWSTLTSNTPTNIGDFTSDDGSEQIPSTNFTGSFVNVNSRGAQNVSQNAFNALVNFGDVGGIEVQALFSAFEADNLGKILATPSIKVMNGQEGFIQVGQDFSIKQRDFAGNVTDQFFSTGTILTVTPQIVEVGDTTMIYLDIQAERSSAQPDPVSTVINKQEANTHALLLDGESTVMAGLYRTEESEVRRGIPILKDLPVWFLGLRYLFGYNSTDVQENELIVLLQAELEKPIAERVKNAYQSQRELLEEKQERHRNNLDRVVDNPLMSNEEQAEITETDTSEAQPDTVTVVEEETIMETEPVEEEPVPVEEEVEETDMKEWQEVEVITETEEDTSDAPAEWREVEMTNVNGENGEYDHLDFYVIGGSFLNRNNADRLYESFKDEGLDAHMLHVDATGYYFVAYKGFETAEDAMPYLLDIQENRQSEAWLSRVIRETRLDLNGD
ncbi:type II and III secretion system protein [Rhodohalobacter mucosus]|nr:type II and III secretion system protein [Rhodohalobacter mucosus]